MESRGIFQTSSPFLHFKRVTSLFEIECRSVYVLFFFSTVTNALCIYPEEFVAIEKNDLKE